MVPTYLGASHKVPPLGRQVYAVVGPILQMTIQNNDKLGRTNEEFGELALFA